MTDTFDPYHKWLGIPPAHQPADHYRLLGIEQFEGDTDVISLAADQRMTFLRTFQNSEQSQLSQRLLNEVAAAKICLLNAKEKARYDAELARKTPPDAPPPLPAGDDSQSAFTAFAVGSQTESASSRSRASTQDKAGLRKKKNQVPVVGIAVVILLLIVLVGLILWGKEKKGSEQIGRTATAQRKETSDAEDAAAPRDRIAPADQREADQKESDQAEAERKKKEEAAKIAAAERKKQEKAEAARIAEAERKAKEKTEQKAPAIQDNPESLLKSKGLVKKGSKWISAIEEPLQKRAQTLQARWKELNSLRRQGVDVDKKIATDFLLRRHELLEQTRSYHVMRAAVAEDYRKILEDEQIMAALEKLGQDTKSLPRTIKQYEKPDKKLRQVLPKGPPQLGNFVLLIINETTPVVIEQDTAMLIHKEAKALLILPRAGWEAAGLPDGTLTQKHMHDQWPPHLWEVAVPSLRWGTLIAKNAKAYRMHNHPANQDEAYGSRVGPVGWQTFLQQLRPAPTPKPTKKQIAAARTKLAKAGRQAKAKKENAEAKRKRREEAAKIAEAERKKKAETQPPQVLRRLQPLPDSPRSRLIRRGLVEENGVWKHQQEIAEATLQNAQLQRQIDLSPRQQELLRKFIDEYRTQTKVEFEVLAADALERRAKVGQTAPVPFSPEGWKRFHFLARYHPDVTAGEFGVLKESSAPFFQKALAKALKLYQGTPQWTAAASLYRTPDRELLVERKIHNEQQQNLYYIYTALVKDPQVRKALRTLGHQLATVPSPPNHVRPSSPNHVRNPPPPVVKRKQVVILSKGPVNDWDFERSFSENNSKWQHLEEPRIAADLNEIKKQVAQYKAAIKNQIENSKKIQVLEVQLNKAKTFSAEKKGAMALLIQRRTAELQRRKADRNKTTAKANHITAMLTATRQRVERVEAMTQKYNGYTYREGTPIEIKTNVKKLTTAIDRLTASCKKTTMQLERATQ